MDLGQGDEEPGASFGEKYVTGEELGRGGMGFVRMAKDQDLGRQVALKCLHGEHRDSETMVRRLISEGSTDGTTGTSQHHPRL